MIAMIMMIVAAMIMMMMMMVVMMMMMMDADDDGDGDDDDDDDDDGWWFWRIHSSWKRIISFLFILYRLGPLWSHQMSFDLPHFTGHVTDPSVSTVTTKILSKPCITSPVDWDSPHKGSAMRKKCACYDIIMTSSCVCQYQQTLPYQVCVRL